MESTSNQPKPAANPRGEASRQRRGKIVHTAPPESETSELERLCAPTAKWQRVAVTAALRGARIQLDVSRETSMNVSLSPVMPSEFGRSVACGARLSRTEMFHVKHQAVGCVLSVQRLSEYHSRRGE